MSSRVLKSVRTRIGRLVGNPQINLRLDQLERGMLERERRDEEVADLWNEVGALDSRMIDHVNTAMVSTMVSARDHADTSIKEQQAHALQLAAEHTEAAITAAQIRFTTDLRAEIESNRVGTSDALDAIRTANGEGLDVVRAELDRVTASLAMLRRRLDAVGMVAPSAVTARTVPAEDGSSRSLAVPAIDPVLYAALEDVFRGDTISVKERQQEYLPLVIGSADDEHPVIDLGCGRGEWLSVLSDAGVAAIGIDSNPIFIKEVHDLGLAIEECDLVDYLRSAPDHSVGAITMFQVLEHLPFAVVTEVITTAYRVLRPGGVLIAEVPNAKNLRVGSGTFWIDPTHERPWYPDVLEFLARTVGFSEVGGRYLNRGAPLVDIDGLSAEVGSLLARLAEAVEGPQDYALIARV